MNPSRKPRITVITIMGNIDRGSFHAMIKADGISTRNAIRTPFSGPLIPRLVVDTRKPATIHMDRAERLASQVRPWRTMRATSTMPRTKPVRTPRRFFSIIIFLPVIKKDVSAALPEAF